MKIFRWPTFGFLFLILTWSLKVSLLPAFAEQTSSISVKKNPASDLAGQDSWLDKIAKPMELNKNTSLKFSLESRYRFEYRDDFTLQDQRYEDDGVNLFRNRLNIDLKTNPERLAKQIRFFAEGQDAHSFAKNGLNKTNQFINQLDLRQLFLEIEKPLQKIPFNLKVGRQELSYGDERFVGALNWTNVARVFDAVKVVFNPWEWFQLDGFYSQPVRTIAKGPDQTVHSDNFYGLYGSYKEIKEHVLDSFLFIRHNSDPTIPSERSGIQGGLTEYTFGNRLKGKKGNVDYGTEYALQFGRRGHDEIEAWAFHQELGYTISKRFGTPRIYTEFNHASGDRNPTDGISSTFDNLFPTNHNKYGLIDFLSLKNMNDIMLGVSLKPHSKVQLASEFHWFFLDAKESAWFNATGGVFRAANANADTQLGEEMDLYATYAINKYLSTLIGYSHFFAGPFAQDTDGNDDANFFYTQLVFKV